MVDSVVDGRWWIVDGWWMNGRVVYGGWMVSRTRMPAHSVKMCMDLLGFVAESQAAQ